jgi:hypothetical protein
MEIARLPTIVIGSTRQTLHKSRIYALLRPVRLYLFIWPMVLIEVNEHELLSKI